MNGGDGGPGDALARAAEPDLVESKRPERFVWPPKSAVSLGAGAPAPPLAPATPAQRPRVSLWRSFESAWLAPTDLPLRERMALEGWSPDAPGAFCDRCGVTTGPHDANEFGCAACRDQQLPWDRFVRLGEHEGSLRSWIHEVKFTRWRRLGRDLGRLLAERLAAAGVPRERLCIVPVPMPWARRLARGIDHSAAIADGVSLGLNAPLAHALGRRWTPAQRAQGATSRRRNVSKAFTLRRGVDLRGWSVVVVDDVRTTGATMRAACRALRGGGRTGKHADAGPEAIWAAVLACAEQPR